MSRESRDRIRWFEYLLAAIVPLIGFFIIWGPQILNGENIYLGVIQEQYYLLGQYSFDHLIRSELAAGQFPLWNPNNALGAPLLGNMLSAAFYPAKILLYFFPGLASYQLFLVFRFWLAGFFAWMLGRKLGLSPGASAFVLCAFSFSGYFQTFLNENYLNADFLLPLLVLLGFLTARGKSKKWPALLALALFALFNSGHPEAVFYDWLFLALSFAGFALGLERADRGKAFGRFAFANACAALLSLPLILTFLEYWVRGYHFHLPGAGLYHYSARELAAVFSPWFFGPAGPGAAFFHPPELGGKLSGLIPAYSKSALPWLAPSLGIIFAPLLCLGVLELRKIPRAYLLWFAWIIFFLGMSFGLPIFQLLGLIPPFNFSGNFKHPWPGLALSASLISALVLERTLSGKVPVRKILPGFIAGAALVAALLPLPKGAFAIAPAVALEAGFCALFLAWAFFSRGLRWSRPVGFGLAAGVVLLGAVLRVSWQGPVYPNYNLSALRANPVFEKLRQDRLARFYFDRELFAPNINQLLEVPALSVMDGVNHRKFVELVNQVNGHSREQGFKYWYNKVGYLEVMPEKIEHPLVDLAGVKYVIAGSPLPYSRTVERLLEAGEKSAPSSGHIGPAGFAFRNASAKTLFQHPPSRIKVNRCEFYKLTGEMPLGCDSGKDLAGELLPAMSFGFYPRIQVLARPRQPDGVWFMIRNGRDLSYARYAHPRAMEYESDLARVKFSVSGNSRWFSFITLPNDNPDFDWSGWMDLRIDEPEALERLELIASNYFWFYENPEALPRFFRGEIGEWDKIENGGAPGEVIFFRERSKSGESGDASGRISVRDFTSQSYELGVEDSIAGWVIISQIFYPGWKAFVDGREAPLSAAGFLSAVNVPGGKHALKLVYQPWSFRVGLYAGLSSALALVVLVLFGRRRGRFEAGMNSELE